MAPDAWNPATEVARLDHEFVDLIDHFMRDDWGEARARAPVNPVPPVESFLDAGHLVIRFDLPGVEPSEVAITVDEALLTIKASRISACESEGRRLLHREIQCGNFERAISIPKGVVRKDLIVTGCHGVLQVIVPIPKNVDIRKVPLKILERARE
jgi:HSP20 family protein